MKIRIPLKKKISILEIGQTQFIAGLIFGLITSILLICAFNYSRELFRYTTQMHGDLVQFPANEKSLTDYLSAAFSISLGMAICSTIWLKGKSKNSGRLWHRILARSNNFLIFTISLLAISRLYSVSFFVLYSLPGFEEQFSLHDDLAPWFFLAPVVIFLQSWMGIRRIYKSQKWMLFSFLTCLILVFVFKVLFSLSTKTVDIYHNEKYADEFKYLYHQLDIASEQYQIEFSPETIHDLKKWRTNKAMIQTQSLKKAFQRAREQNSLVSLDTILLEKIAIHNLKSIGYFYQSRNQQQNWSFAEPFDIYEQLQKRKTNPMICKELAALLKEEILIVNTKKIDWSKRQNFNHYERRKDIYLRTQAPNFYGTHLKIINQLIQQDSILKVYLPEIPKVSKYDKEYYLSIKDFYLHNNNVK